MSCSVSFLAPDAFAVSAGSPPADREQAAIAELERQNKEMEVPISHETVQHVDALVLLGLTLLEQLLMCFRVSCVRLDCSCLRSKIGSYRML